VSYHAGGLNGLGQADSSDSSDGGILSSIESGISSAVSSAGQGIADVEANAVGALPTLPSVNLPSVNWTALAGIGALAVIVVALVGHEVL
jgi:hypothetical protein